MIKIIVLINYVIRLPNSVLENTAMKLLTTETVSDNMI